MEERRSYDQVPTTESIPGTPGDNGPSHSNGERNNGHGDADGEGSLPDKKKLSNMMNMGRQ